MNTFVRPATASDIESVADLELQYRRAVAAVERGGAELLGERPEIGVSGWRERLTRTDWIVVVAGIDDVVLGAGACSIRPGSLVASVELLWVHPDAREVGLGETLLESLTDSARKGGAARIEATALPGDRDTKNLFERAGLVARLIIVSSPL